VVVLEKEGRPGGRASSWRHAPSGDVVDIGPHILTTAYRNFPAMLDRVGTGAHVKWQGDTMLTFGNTRPPTRLRHRPLTPPLSLLPDIARAQGIGWRDLASNARPTWHALTFTEADVARLDAVPGLEYLRGCGVTPRMIDWFWRFACMAVLNVPIERCSTAALLRVHSLFIGQRRMRFCFPTLPLGELFAEPAVREIERAGSEVRLEAEVVRLERHADENVAHLANGAQCTAPHAVIALPPAALERLHGGLARTEAFAPSPYVSVYTWFDRVLSREPFWALQWTPRRMNYDFYDLANIRPGERQGSLVASNIIHSHRTGGMSDEALVRATVAEIAEFLPQARTARVVHADVHRIPMAICEPAPGTEMLRPPTHTAVAGWVLAGDWVRTGMPLSMESAARSGLLAAEEVLAQRGAPRRLAFELPSNDGLAGFIQALARRRPRRAGRAAPVPAA
jgi:hypothetical protein